MFDVEIHIRRGRGPLSREDAGGRVGRLTPFELESLPADDILGVAITCHGGQTTSECRIARMPVPVRNRSRKTKKETKGKDEVQAWVGDREGFGLMSTFQFEKNRSGGVSNL